MEAYTIYLDQVFFSNLAMNYAILWAAAKLSRLTVSKGRLAAGAALGALYSIAVFIPDTGMFLTLWFKTAASIIITAVTFAPLPPKKFLTCLGCFYLSSFTLGGLVFGLIFFIHSGQVEGYNGIGRVIADYFWPGIFLGLAAFWAAGKAIASLQKKHYLENFLKIPLLIKSGGKQVEVEAFLDTGNQLRDPLTRHPVVVAEYGVLKPILPGEAHACFEGDGEPDVWGFLGSLSDNLIATRFSAVPFHSLGNVNGLMVGFRPDEVVIIRREKPVRVGKIVIAIYPKRLDSDGSYHALLGLDLFELVS